MAFPSQQAGGKSPVPLRTRVAATVLLALCAAAASLAQAQPMPNGPAHAMAHHRAGSERAGGPMMSGRMLDAVGASADQKSRIQAIMARVHEEGRAQHDGERGLHQQMVALLAAPRIDAAAAEDIRQKLQAGRESASKRQLQAMLDASAVLTPEQRQKLADTALSRREMMQRHQQERRALDPKG